MMSIVGPPLRRTSRASPRPTNRVPQSYEEQFEEAQSIKRRGLLSKVGKYLKEQADQQNYSSLHLTPATQGSLQRVPVAWGTTKQSEIEDLRERLYQTVTVLDKPAFLQSGSTRSARPSAPNSRTNSMMDSTGIQMKRIQYASDNILQSYDVFIPERENSSATESKVWVVYVHGGYFRDVKVDSTSLRKTIAVLENKSDTGLASSAASTVPSLTESTDTAESTDESDKTPSIADSITGYASINYRLSPHPAYPQDHSRTPDYELRTAQWPEHLSDVTAALKHLQTQYGFGSNYVLAGHSVGATLAFLLTLNCAEHDILPPRALVGMSGIYDFPQIHETNPEYLGMTANAMDARYFSEASPACHNLAEYASKWKLDGPRKVLLAHSKDDGLVEWGQVTRMQNVLASGSKQNIQTSLLELFGEHNDIWVEGKECARAIREAVESLQ